MHINRKIDHIVYAVPDLTRACDHVESELGIRPQFGGHHKTKGTMNALLNLGNACYLELLAVDESNTDITGPRWMGIDLISEPRITRWSLKSNDLETDQTHIQQFNPALGQISGGKRLTPTGDSLQWHMILPLAHPEIDIIPFMTDWAGSSVHPTDKLINECLLTEMTFTHPEAQRLQIVFDNLAIESTVHKGDKVGISIEIARGDRRITLS